MVPGSKSVNLLGFSEMSGSYALGRSHFDVFLWVLERTRRQIEEVINEQLIKQLVDYNYIADSYPKFRFKPMTEDDREGLLASWLRAVAAGVVQPHEADENKIREQLGFPVTDPAADTRRRITAGTFSSSTSDAAGLAGSVQDNFDNDKTDTLFRADIERALRKINFGLLDYMSRRNRPENFEIERVPLKYLPELKNVVKVALFEQCGSVPFEMIENAAYEITGTEKAVILKRLQDALKDIRKEDGNAILEAVNSVFSVYFSESPSRIDEIVARIKEFAEKNIGGKNE